VNLPNHPNPCQIPLALFSPFCDFQSAVIFCRATSQSWRARLEDNRLEHVWKRMFQRQRFCPLIQQKTSHDNYLMQCLYRRRLLQNLLQPQRNKKKSNHCFNLPHSYFQFVPIVSRHDNNDDELSEREKNCPRYDVLSSVQVRLLVERLIRSAQQLFPLCRFRAGWVSKT
jgi:hypothetical protein